MVELPSNAPIDPYRAGYRDGFSDGWHENSALKPPPPPSPPAGKDGKDDKDKDKGEDKPKDDDKSKDDKSKDQDKDKDKNKTPLYKRPLIVAIALLVVLLLIITAIIFWRHASHHEKTDDAFIDGHASAVSSQTAGRVVKLLVNDNQEVKAGDLLVEIDARDLDARAAQARAQLADAQGQLATARAQIEVRAAATAQATANARQAAAQLAQAEQDQARYRKVDPDAVARQQVDTASTQVQSARAQLDAARATERSTRAQTAAAETQVQTAQAGVDAAQAQVSAADLQVSYTKVYAPADGHVTRRMIEVGNVITAGQSLMAIVGADLWVTANYKETQLTRMQPGQAVEISVDAFPDVTFRAHVDSIQRGTGSYFSMLPAENATGNFVKVAQRVPVKIVFEDVNQLRQYAIGPGMSVTPNVSLP
jgi:membrane fusion protein (multidrug efflux system)